MRIPFLSPRNPVFTIFYIAVLYYESTTYIPFLYQSSIIRSSFLYPFYILTPSQKPLTFYFLPETPLLFPFDIFWQPQYFHLLFKSLLRYTLCQSLNFGKVNYQHFWHYSVLLAFTSFSYSLILSFSHFYRPYFFKNPFKKAICSSFSFSLASYEAISLSVVSLFS